jgi:transglutaminase-like putative cysteine protease/predicted glutamine amidotransferase
VSRPAAASEPGRILALSLDTAASPAFGFPRRDPVPGAAALGWGFAWYPADRHGARLIRDDTVAGDNAMTRILREWGRFESDLFLLHLHDAGRDESQPFCRSFAGHDWTFVHEGALGGDVARRLPLGEAPVFEPVGRSHAEHAFCWLLGAAREHGARRLWDLSWERLHDWLRAINDLGPATLVLSDGEDLVAYQDRNGFGRLGWFRHQPPRANRRFTGDALTLDLGRDAPATAFVVASLPFSDHAWQPMHGGQMVVARGGALLFDSHRGLAPVAGPLPIVRQRQAPPRTRYLRVVHETVYAYGSPVHRSEHHFRLRPVHDPAQELLEYDLSVSTGGFVHEYEDVFGNHAARVVVEEPYREMRIVSRSLVRVADGGPVRLPTRSRPVLPLVWMPWHRQMMSPYLLPPELPEAELRALSDYAMSFARRWDGDLIDTLSDINAGINRDYAYVPGVTSVETTPYEVFSQRRGVCQDFAQLFICLARLLSIPARYRTGYIYTGGDYANQAQSEASHAWIEVYIPELGWRGFDPTNGSLAGADHVRVAAGRHYRDAAPTSGTIYAGGGSEVLRVSVRVEAVDQLAAVARGGQRAVQQAAQQAAQQ